MKNILVIGGTGNISWNLVQQAVKNGDKVSVIVRDSKSPLRRTLPSSVEIIRVDVREEGALLGLMSGRHFDAVYDFLCFTAQHAKSAINIFLGKTKQYFFISTTAIYGRNVSLLPFKEDAVTSNLNWQYAVDKYQAESIFINGFKERGFPVVIIRPGHTYDQALPVAVGPGDWTVPARMIAGKPVIIHGDGSTLWTITHAEDLARALYDLSRQLKAIGQSFHITNSEWTTWNDITYLIADALGLADIDVCYVATNQIDFLDTYYAAGIKWHKMWSDIYDNSKIHRFLPSWSIKIKNSVGIRKSIDWYLENPERQVIRRDFDELMDRLAASNIRSKIICP